MGIEAADDEKQPASIDSMHSPPVRALQLQGIGREVETLNCIPALKNDGAIGEHN